jgi:hypothetical protein
MLVESLPCPFLIGTPKIVTLEPGSCRSSHRRGGVGHRKLQAVQQGSATDLSGLLLGGEDGGSKCRVDASFGLPGPVTGGGRFGYRRLMKGEWIRKSDTQLFQIEGDSLWVGVETGVRGDGPSEWNAKHAGATRAERFELRRRGHRPCAGDTIPCGVALPLAPFGGLARRVYRVGVHRWLANAAGLPSLRQVVTWPFPLQRRGWQLRLYDGRSERGELVRSKTDTQPRLR